MSLLHFFLGFTGRITRQQFWLGLLALMLIAIVAVSLIDPDAMRAGTISQPSLALAAWDLFVCWPNAAIVIKRFNDRDHPPWIGQLLALLLVVLVLGNHAGYMRDVTDMMLGEKIFFSGLLLFFIWVLVDAGFLPGTAGDNRHGPDPLDRTIPDERQA